MKWTKEEEQYLITNWNGIITEQMKYRLSRSYSAIEYKSKTCGLKKKLRIASVYPLTQSTHTSFYWMGFLMADGYFSPTGTISVTVGYKDLEFITQLAELLNCNISIYKRKPNNIVRLAIQDISNCSILKNFWDLNNTKTKIPPKTLPKLTKEQFYSWVIGFIDGDGSIETHGSSGSLVSSLEWDHIMKYISKMLECPKLEQREPSQTGFSINPSLRLRLTAKSLKLLKEHIVTYNLPAMARKWERVKLHNSPKLS